MSRDDNGWSKPALRPARISDALPTYLIGPMARHSGASLAMKLFALGSGFLFAVATARLLGPSGYGIVAVALSGATVVATVSLLGIDGLALREAAALATRNQWGELRRFIRWAVLSVLMASVVSGQLLAFTGLLPGSFGSALLLASLAVPLLAGLLLLRAIIQGTGNVIAAQLPAEVIRWVVTLSLIVALLVWGIASPTAVIAVVLAALAVSVAVSAGVLRRLLARRPMGEPPATPARHRLKQASPFLFVAVFGIVGTEISTLLLGVLAGPREAGLYQPIAKLAPIMLLASSSVEAALAPRIVQRWEDADRAGLERLMRRSALAATITTAAITGAILIASPYILLAFGQEFTAYQSYLYWVGAAQLVNVAMGSSALLLAMVGDMSQRLRAQALTLLTQAVFAVVLIPSMGAAGAVISLTVAILTWAISHWWLAWRATGINTFAFASAKFPKGDRT